MHSRGSPKTAAGSAHDRGGQSNARNFSSTACDAVGCRVAPRSGWSKRARELNQLKAQRNQANSQLKYMQERHDRTEDSAERCS